MLFLLDTNALSDLMRDHPRLRLRLRSLAPTDRVCTSTVSRGEVLHGIEVLAPGRKRTTLESQFASLTPSVPCEPVPCEAAEYYARVKNACRLKGVALDENDLWIAATAMALGATLVTRDRDFAAVNALTVEDWTA